MLELEVMASIRIPKKNTALPKSVDSGTDRGGSGTDSIGCDSAGARDEPKGRTVMARGRHPTWQENGNGFSPNGGPGGHETSGPRALYIAFWAVSLLFLLVTAAGVIAAQTGSDGAPAGDG